MTRGIAYTRGRAATAATGLAAALAIGLLYHHMGAARAGWRRENAELEGTLAAQIASLPRCESADVDALRTRVRSFRNRLGPPDAWDRLLARLGRDWKGSPDPRQHRSGYALQAGSLELPSASTADWPAILDAVRTIEEAPGVGVVAFEMRTGGDRIRRSVDLVRVRVALQTEPRGAVPPAP